MATRVDLQVASDGENLPTEEILTQWAEAAVGKVRDETRDQHQDRRCRGKCRTESDLAPSIGTNQCVVLPGGPAGAARAAVDR